MDWLILLGALAAAHFIADYPLQPQYMVDEKVGPPGFRRNLALVAHSTIAGFCAAVALAIVGLPDSVLVFGFVFNAVMHGIADLGKVRHEYGLGRDQAFHAMTGLLTWTIGVLTL